MQVLLFDHNGRDLMNSRYAIVNASQDAFILLFALPVPVTICGARLDQVATGLLRRPSVPASPDCLFKWCRPRRQRRIFPDPSAIHAHLHALDARCVGKSHVSHQRALVDF
jgi:hypothetical protein